MTDTAATTELDRLAETLGRHGQAHLLDGIDELDEPTRHAFLERLAVIDWAELEDPPDLPDPGEIRPSRVATRDEQARRRDELVRGGEAAYRAGRVAVLMVAGGQGTRLGFKGPKGCFPLAPHSGKTIYQLQAEKVVSLTRRIGRAPLFLVMTSPATDAETRAFFETHGRFGIPEDRLELFSQGTVPSVDREGRALLAVPGRLLENPDGHGGAFTALVESRNLARLRDEGVTHLIYLQVDNILAPVDDPLLVGLAVREAADVVTKVLEKSDPDEKVGHLVNVGGRDHIIEYTELTPEETRAHTATGELVYRWGSPAMHCWSVPFFTRLAERGFRLPLHRSAKPLRAWVGGAVHAVDGWKYERFIFDLVAEAETSIGMEVEREAEFAPIKNASGDSSPATAVELAHRQYAAWLEAAGVRVTAPPGTRIEISPLLGATREQFVENWDGRCSAVTGDVYLEAVGSERGNG